MIIQHNLSAMFTQNKLNVNTNEQAKRSERLSSGYKINRAADNATGLVISEQMRGQIKGLEQASYNIQDGISFSQTADGALSEMHSITQRMRELCVQGANDSNVTADRNAINEELNALSESLNHISKTTEFNEIRPFKPVNAPTITGFPTDIKVWNSTPTTAADKNYGGIWYENQRYTWDEFRPTSPVGADGNLVPGEYTLYTDKHCSPPLVPPYALKPVTIPFKVKESGLSPNQITREYKMVFDEQKGITIDNNLHKWSDMLPRGLDPNDPKPGNYEFVHCGMHINFTVNEGEDIHSIIDKLKPDGLAAFEWIADPTAITNVQSVNNITVTNYPIDANNKDMVGFASEPGSNSSAYYIVANDNGVTIKATNGNTNNDNHTVMSWKDLGIESWENELETPPKIGYKPTIDQNKTYLYTDQTTGLTLSFTIIPESSKQEIFNRLNNAPIIAPLVTPTIGTIDAGQTITNSLTSFSYSSSSVKFSTQDGLARDFDSLYWNFDKNSKSQKLTFTGSDYSLSYTSTNGKTITFTAKDDDFKSSLKSAIISGIRGHATTCETNLKLTNIDTSRTSPDNSITFTSKYNISSVATPLWSEHSAYVNSQGFKDSVNNELKSQFPGIDLNNLTWQQQHYKTNFESSLSNSKLDTLINSTYSTNITDLATSVSTSVKNSNTNLNFKTNGSAAYTSMTPVPISSPVNISSFGQVTNLPPRLLHIQAGANTSQVIGIILNPVNASILRVHNLKVDDYDLANHSIGNVDFANDYISKERVKYGAKQNQMEHAMSNVNNSAENHQKAESLIRDADMAKEMVLYSKAKILANVSQSMLAQANMATKNVIDLLK